MSLVEPTIWDKIPHKRLLVYAGLGLLLLGVGLFLWQCGDDYLFKSKVQKQKDEIANELKEITNVSNQIIELEKKKEGLALNVNAATEELKKDLFGLEEAKKETDEALANFQRAVNANDNVNRTAQDLEDALKRLGNQ